MVLEVNESVDKAMSAAKLTNDTVVRAIVEAEAAGAAREEVMLTAVSAATTEAGEARIVATRAEEHVAKMQEQVAQTVMKMAAKMLKDSTLKWRRRLSQKCRACRTPHRKLWPW